MRIDRRRGRLEDEHLVAPHRLDEAHVGLAIREPLDGREPGPEAALARRRELMQRQVRQLTRLTEDLLDVTRISQGRVLLCAERLDLGQLLRESVEDCRDRSRGGLGLGLALVRGLVALHGGEVTAASDGPGHGTELAVRLPQVTEAPRG